MNAKTAVAVPFAAAFAAQAAFCAAKPTKSQLEWADCEIGVIIHQDVQVYVPSYEDHADTNVPPASVFNPSALDTDQWLETAKAAGAKYAVLVAKHCSGFSLWPTKAHDYSVASSPWKGGKGDVVADFIASCRKYGIKPGLYASTGRNNYFGVSDLKAGYKTIPDGKWNRYRELVRTQLTELWSNYGELFEIWFDGGNLPAGRGAREIEELIAKLQPNAVVFGGDPARNVCCRWVGNENATSPYDCWSRWTPPEKEGYPEYLKKAMGAPDGRYWCPAESDIPNRNQHTCFQGGWFWREGEERGLYTPAELLDRYMKSVGRNSNLLIGMVIDNRGLVPDADVEQFRRFGELVRGLYRNRLARVSGRGLRFDIDLPADSGASLCSIREDIADGENVRRFRLKGFAGGVWKELASGGTVGHRRLLRFKPGPYTRYRLEFEPIEPGTLPVLRDFELYSAATPRVSFELPSRLYAAPGREANVYFKNVFASVTPGNFVFEADCAAGRAQKERWTWTPEASDAGRTVKLVLRAWTDAGCVAEAETSVVVAPAPREPGRTVRLALFADSLTNCGYQDELAKALRADGFTGYTPVGSRKPKLAGRVPHDGFGGYDCNSFLTYYNVTEDEIERVQDKAEREQLKALGVPVKIVAEWQRSLLKSPLITPENGKKTVNVTNWLKKATGGTPPDVVVIQLGVNSVFGISGTAARKRDYIDKKVIPGFDRLIAALRPHMPEAVFAVTTQPIGCGQDGFGANYGAKRGGEIHHRVTMFELNRAIREHVLGLGDPKIELVPLAQQIDPFHGYLHVTRPANARTSETAVRDHNALHPSASGGRQMADALAAWFECRWNDWNASRK